MSTRYWNLVHQMMENRCMISIGVAETRNKKSNLCEN
jgi:hypothetical protein